MDTIDEAQVESVQNSNRYSRENNGTAKMTGNEVNMQYSCRSRRLAAAFRKIQITGPERPKKETVADEKLGLIFQTKIKIGGFAFNIWVRP